MFEIIFVTGYFFVNLKSLGCRVSPCFTGLEYLLKTCNSKTPRTEYYQLLFTAINLDVFQILMFSNEHI